MSRRGRYYVLFFFNDTATTEIYTLSLHDALPIFIFIVSEEGFAQLLFLQVQREDRPSAFLTGLGHMDDPAGLVKTHKRTLDRKSTRLNSSHTVISYAVFCLKKQNDD